MLTKELEPYVWGKQEMIENQVAEMQRIDDQFEKKTEMMKHLVNIESVPQKTMDNLIEECKGQDMPTGEVLDDIGRMAMETEKDKFVEVKAKNKTQPVVEKRRSSRLMDNDGKVQEKAEKIKECKNKITGNNSFSALNNIDDNNMKNVAIDSGLVLGSSKDSAIEIISAFQAKELALKTLVEARRRREEEKKKKIDTGQERIEGTTEEDTGEEEKLQITEGMDGPSEPQEWHGSCKRGFRVKVIDKWPQRNEANILDYWQKCIVHIRRFCRGWGANQDSAIKKSKQELKDKLTRLDAKAEAEGLRKEEWQERYRIERELE